MAYKKRETETRRCKICGTEFTAYANGNKKYCCNKCAGIAHRICDDKKRAREQLRLKQGCRVITETTKLIVVMSREKGQPYKLIAKDMSWTEYGVRKLAKELKESGEYGKIAASIHQKPELYGRSITGRICVMPNIRQDQLIKG